jgi:hypothetical protein
MKKAPRIMLLAVLFLVCTMIYAVAKELFPSQYLIRFFAGGAAATIWFLVYVKTKEQTGKQSEQPTIYRKSRYHQ